MDLSIIIVNWNSTDLAVKCIESIFAHIHGLEFEIIVVDNASSNGSCTILESRFRQVKLLRSAENLGFARANNLGFRHSTGKCILFLNPDTEITSSAINLMYSYLCTEVTAGAVGCKLLNGDLSVQTSCIQRFPTVFNQLADIDWLRLRFPYLSVWGMQALFAHDQTTPATVDIICGACIMLKREVFEAIDLFSTTYFMYGEDVDLCYKIKKAGWKLYYLGNGTIVHLGKQSSALRTEDSFGVVVTRESVFRLLRKTRGSLYAYFYRFSLLAMALFRLLIFSLVLGGSPKMRNSGPLRCSMRKWWKILRWSVGLEKWTQELGRPLTPEVLQVKS